MADERTNAPPSSGEYPAYSALWHLFQIGIVENDRFESRAWDKAEERAKQGSEGKPPARPTRVALIDTSVAWNHPNLAGAINTGLMIDFFSARLGAFEPNPGPGTADLRELVKRARAAGAPLRDKHAAIGTLFDALLDRLDKETAAAAHGAKRAGKSAVRPATLPAFSAHGTAMAGLIGARPAQVKPYQPQIQKTADVPLVGPGIGEAERTLPYVGVDPFCEIVPISTNQEPDPEQYILTLLYAAIIDADIIVLPRDIPDPFRSPAAGTLKGADKFAVGEAYPVQISQDDTSLWDAFNSLIVDMSKTRPILCAAGNGSDDIIIYPANLAKDDNGIIAVGARNALGRPSSFTSGSNKHAKVTVYAPSGDAERLDREVRRLDTTDDDFRQSEHDDEDLEQAAEFAVEDIITTDVPGPGGYNASRFRRANATDGTYHDISSLFCRFSGTSAAVAIAAGLLSLAVSSGVLAPGDGVAAKQRLRGPAKKPPQKTKSTTKDEDIPSISWKAFKSTSPARVRRQPG